VTKLSCAKDTTLDRSSHTICRLEVVVLYLYGCFIIGFSGVAMGGKGLNLMLLILRDITNGRNRFGSFWNQIGSISNDFFLK